MYVPGVIKRVLKKANLEKQKAVSNNEVQFDKNNPVVKSWITGDKKTIQYEDGSIDTYEIEQVFSGVFQSSIDEAASKSLESSPLPLDFVNLTKAEFNALGNKVGDYNQHNMPEEVTTLDEANIVTSLVEGKEKIHAAVIDFDFPHVYVPSSTPGHGHLYIDKEWDEDTFFTFLEMLVDFGLVEPGYYQASKARGYSAVRLPHIKKEAIDG